MLKVFFYNKTYLIVCSLRNIEKKVKFRTQQKNLGGKKKLQRGPLLAKYISLLLPSCDNWLKSMLEDHTYSNTGDPRLAFETWKNRTMQNSYSKVLRCTFFGEWKNSFSSKFVQLELLNKAKARTSKNRAA